RFLRSSGTNDEFGARAGAEAGAKRTRAPFLAFVWGRTTNSGAWAAEPGAKRRRAPFFAFVLDEWKIRRIDGQA
ncbi:MAG: hypothetical protein Q8P18_29730, partial [Pseudomonadota bacterium]|nr:hypothetical protein [Pseudomonadota bacterium]